MNQSRIFVWGLNRFILILIFAPRIQVELFYPFLNDIELNLLDPWTSWLQLGGRSDAFPYGIVMFLCFVPAILCTQLLSMVIGFSSTMIFPYFFISTLLLIEYLLYKSIGIFEKQTRRSWAWFIILSPLGIYISFVHGQIDVIPAYILLCAAQYILKNNWGSAGLAVGIAIATKFSFVIVVPFLIVYFLSKPIRYREGIIFAKNLFPGLILFFTPIVYSSGYRDMVLGTPEVLKTLDARINIGIAIVYIAPIAYLLVLLVFSNLVHISNFVLISFIGAALTVIAMAQSSSIGWFYWGLALTLFALKDASVRTFIFFWFWQCGVCAYYLLEAEILPIRGGGWNLPPMLGNPTTSNLIFTFNSVLGAVLVIKILREALQIGDIYKIARKPLVLLIAGDSGVGKDTLTNEIAGVFGTKEVSLLLGDDYHLHERGDTSWLNTTHLSPEANDLETMGRDFRKLVKREPILVRHYDHGVGRFTLPRRITASQVVIVNGLHANLIDGTSLADLRIFISMAEDLRIDLKIARDIGERSQASEKDIRSSIAYRLPHYNRFIAPQADLSDVHFKISRNIINSKDFVVSVSMKDIAHLHDIKRQINSIYNIPATLTRLEGLVWLDIDSSNFSAEDASAVLRRNVVSLEQLFPESPRFSDGSIGVMGLISVLALIRKRQNNV
jgi:uridine kinase